MKYLFLIVLILLLFFTIGPKGLFADSGFVKSSLNPLEFSGDLPNWNEQIRLQSTLLYENNLFKMWYSSAGTNGSKIVYADSLDGLHWTRRGLLTIEDGYANHDASIIRDENKLRLFFAANNNGLQYHINQVDLQDESTPDMSTFRTIILPNHNWNTYAVSSPLIYKENGSYYLFYVGSNGNGWNLGLATSSDGTTWTECPNNPVIYSADGPALIKTNSGYTIYIHTTAGEIHSLSTQDTLSCSTNWSNRQLVLRPGPDNYDATFVSGPSVIQKQDVTYLYYSGRSVDQIWTLDLATNPDISTQTTPTPSSQPSLTPTLIPSPTPTFIPTSTPSPSPRPYPTQVVKRKIVIIPGMLASWNKEAMLHDAKVSQMSWKLLPSINEYKGLEATLEHLGYRKNVDYYEFPYDWRQSITKTSDDLNNFLHQISQGNDGKRITLIGHSLGGLIGRIYAQSHENMIDRIVTVGSPHKGTAKVYTLTEGGDIEVDNTLEWLAAEIVLQLNKTTQITDRQVIEDKFPVAFDLFPTTSVFQDPKGNSINISSMIVQNNTLASENTYTGEMLENLYTIAGNKQNTLEGYRLARRTLTDTVFNLYPDGRVFRSLYDVGDGTVTEDSALFGPHKIALPLNHGELIYTKRGIAQILTDADVPYSQFDIKAGAATDIAQSLIILVQSPITLSASIKNNTFTESDGILLIPNAEQGHYTLIARGTANGNFTIHAGQISDNHISWQNIKGNIKTNQKLTYTMVFESKGSSDEHHKKGKEAKEHN